MIAADWPSGAKALALTADGAAVNEQVLSAVLTDDINGAEDPKLGSTCAAELTLVIEKPSVSWAGKTITAAVGGVPLGTFTVTNVAAKDGHATITAVDAMATAFGGDYTPAAETSTALAVIREISAACGVALGDMSGVTDVPVTGLKEGHTCREMLGLMAALLGRNAHIGRDGRLCLRWYAASGIGGDAARAEDPDGTGHIILYGVEVLDDGAGNVRLVSNVQVTDDGDGNLVLFPGEDGVSVTADDYYAGALTMQDEDYAIARLECAVTRTVRTENGDGTAAEETETVVYAAGSGATGVSIMDEFMTQSVLDGVLAAIGGLVYRPMTVTFYGDARIETGDILTLTDADGQRHTVPVMKVTHVWDGGVKTTVQAYGHPSEGMSVSSGGYLSKSVSNLMAEFARFKNLEAENLRAQNAKFARLFADWADIGTAIVNTLEAEGVSADWINAGSLLAAYLKLYGTMSVYTDDTLATEGGKLGYTTGNLDLPMQVGMILASALLKGVTIVSDDGAYLAYKGDSDYTIEPDGGAEIDISDRIYGRKLQLDDDGVTIQGGARADGELADHIPQGDVRILPGADGRVLICGYPIAESAHDGAMASNTRNWVYPSELSELSDKVNIRTYSSVTQLGLTSGSATIADALDAMPVNSMLVCPAETFQTSEVPNTYGTVRITKSNNISRTVIEFLGKEDANGDYRMYLTSANAPTGTWLRNGRPYAQTVDATIAAGSTSTTVTAPAVTGRTFLCWCAVATIGWQGAAYCAAPVSATSSVFTSSGTSANARTVRCTALYI